MLALGLVFAATVTAVVPTVTAAVPPAPSHWVEDHAGMMSPAARDGLDARLGAYERATGHQIVVWIDHTLGGAALDDWSVRTFAAWKVGRAGLDDGIAMFVFADDHKIDIEVGYGLEAKVPDAVAARVIREIMAPRLRDGDADAAIREGTDAVLTAVEGRAWRADDAPDAVDAPTTATWIVGGIALLAMVILFITHPRLFLLLLLFGRRGGGGGSGGGFTGGGGHSGGGGARGGW
jgi:uncharacterized protein